MFLDYCAATGQPALPTTRDAVRGFFRQVPAAPATRVRRLRAIARAHRDAGALFDHPPGPTGPDSGTVATDVRAAEAMIAACPARGWPAGFTGRRDAFLVVLTRVLGYPHHAARGITGEDIDTAGEDVIRIRGAVVPTSQNPRGCPRCAVARWLAVLDQADGIGRDHARKCLRTAPAPTAAAGEHVHTHAEPQGWRRAGQLLPAIDQHGWIDDYQPLSLRSITTRLRRAEHRDPDTATEPPVPQPRPATPGLVCDDAALSALLDDVETGAADLDARIEAVLAEDAARHTRPG